MKVRVFDEGTVAESFQMLPEPADPEYPPEPKAPAANPMIAEVRTLMAAETSPEVKAAYGTRIAEMTLADRAYALSYPALKAAWDKADADLKKGFPTVAAGAKVRVLTAAQARGKPWRKSALAAEEAKAKAAEAKP